MRGPAPSSRALAKRFGWLAATEARYYRLIVDVGPTRAMTVTFLMPLFGMVWSVLFLGETVTLPMIAGCALIVGGTALVVRQPGRATVVTGGAPRKT